MLELGFDDTAPNRPVTISSWAYDAAVQAGEAFPANFMRHDYDIYCLLALPEIQEFIGTSALYYGQPDLGEFLARIRHHIEKM